MQATDLSKMNGELTVLRKEFATSQRNNTKEQNALKEQVATLKAKLLQTERDLNDANISCASGFSTYNLYF
jgi:multidrug resistance efflux pump